MSLSLNLHKFMPYRVNRMAHNISSDLATIYEERFGVTKEQWRTILLIGQYETLTAKQVAELTYMDKVKISRAVNRLADIGYIHREPSTTDKRAVVLSLTQAGIDLYEQITPLMQEWEEQMLQRLTLEERQQLFSIIDKLDPID